MKIESCLYRIKESNTKWQETHQYEVLRVNDSPVPGFPRQRSMASSESIMGNDASFWSGGSFKMFRDLRWKYVFLWFQLHSRIYTMERWQWSVAGTVRILELWFISKQIRAAG